ncbi:MAG: hypothetical protein LZF62_440033 [Nitrospira sp.]|nr:MAG: hypothetical protein LZF62_440033 [Nitrospira sp.]
MSTVALPAWEAARAKLRSSIPQFYELEPGGALVLDLGDDGWILELRSDGQFLCQHGIAMDDVKSLMCDGTTEDLGTDEVAKQAKYFLGPAVSKKRPALLRAGFAEQTDMNDDYVAITFLKTVDFERYEDVLAAVRWCQNLFKA